MSGRQISTTDLAYIGDCVYELYIRQLMLKQGWTGSDRLHRETVGYVRAESQALALKRILPQLTPEEADLCRRARNRKSATKPKNVHPTDYKLATALEALIGSLYLAGDLRRMEEIMDMAASAIGNKEERGPEAAK